MENVLQIYICPNCGEILEDETYFTVDGQCHCLRCNSPAEPKRAPDIEYMIQKACKFYRLVDRRRWLEARGHYDARQAR